MDDIVITRDNWTNIINAVRKINPKASVRECLLDYYPVCINHIITPLSRELWNIYCHVDGFKNNDFASYMDLPQVIYEGFVIIQREVDRIDKVRRSKQEATAEHQSKVTTTKRGYR